MDRQALLDSARKIMAPSPETAKEFSDKRVILTRIIKQVLDAKLSLPESDKAQKSGMDRNDHTYHLMHMEGLFTAYSPEEYVDTTLWTARMYRSHGFNLNHWETILKTITDIFKTELTPKAYGEIYPFYEWMISNIPDFISITDNQAP
ncbi:MAG TPA: hypothetical protein PLB12_09285 [Candidatus Goldiibacteriota bacterium]|nr:hypothetical protein [Candidatus Goldiibacteriota bacterium]HPN65496.1 hypothetical protein [Candidatus Goldiibacteriota bacterium]HRQ44532.1 hypothetical protein [Candidatus Goldiibacteriota bacterium]